MGEIKPPSPLTDEHIVKVFDCGYSSLNTWLQRDGMQNQKANASRTFVVCVKNKIVGFYSLAVGSVEYEHASKRMGKGLARHPIPVMVLARLAVDLRYQGNKIGAGLLKDAILRTLQASEHAGIRAILVQAKDDKTRAFYQHFKFELSPSDPLQLMLLVKDARKIVEISR